MSDKQRLESMVIRGKAPNKGDWVKFVDPRAQSEEEWSISEVTSFFVVEGEREFMPRFTVKSLPDHMSIPFCDVLEWRENGSGKFKE